ncbi:MAG: hypothetical protein COA79_06195 [Planctomycetota bacterium]|nr:MAG: hypothetical protein COA79_06195 [Planctomycetota bacterium]
MTKNNAIKYLFCFILITFLFNFKAQDMTADEKKMTKTKLTIQVPHVNNSKRIYRAILLKNGLKVLLVSDSKVNHSAASIDVSVGSLEDPKDQQGLFHFLEHMLFLGTKKYPKVGQYSAFLKKNSGSSNAYTSEESTNYHFKVSHNGLEEAIDRFAQFFISPIFNKEKTDTEVQNVNSEHQKNIPKDYWRGRQILRSLYKKNHPANHFSTGNNITLKSCRRESLIKMFNKYYSSNLMALCILSNKSLDDLEILATKYFSDIPNRNSIAPKYPENYLDTANGLRILKIIPKKNIHQLDIQFALPNLTKYRNEKPLQLLGSILGHEGKGTITSHLKKKGFISSLSAGGYIMSSYSRFSFSIALTENGKKNISKILETVFAYISMLQSSPFPEYYYLEQQKLVEINLENHEEKEGTNYVSNITSSINEYGISNILTAPYLFPPLSKSNEKSYYLALKNLTVKTAIVSIFTQNQKTDQVEEYYKAHYSYEIDKELGNKLKNVSFNFKLHLPKPNAFIPKSTKLISPRPYLLVYNSLNEIWYEQDQVFKLPKTHIRLQILTNELQKSLKNQLLGRLYTSAIIESLNEDIYPMQIAGLGYQISNDFEGINLSFNGYSSNILEFFDFVTNRLKSIKISKDIFLSLKDRMKRSYLNRDFSPAYQQAFLLFNSLNNKNYYSIKNKLKVLETISLNELKDFVKKRLFKKVFIRGSVYGNTKPELVQNAIENFTTYLGSSPLSRKDFPKLLIAQLNKKNPHIVLSKKLAINNSAILSVHSFGLENPKMRGAALVLSKILNGPYYADMRTKQHLGYIVWSFMDQEEHNIYQSFIIQSGEYSADHLIESSNNFLKNFEKVLIKLPKSDFDKYKKVVIDRKLEKPKTISAQNNIFFKQAFKKKGDFDHVASDVKAVESLSKKDVIQLFKKIINPKIGKSITVLCYGKDHEQKVLDTTEIKLKELRSEVKYE